MNTKIKTPVLLIEDNKADADLIEIYMNEVGFRYEWYHSDSLEKGIELIETHQIEITLLDLSLADSSGFKTLSKYLDRASHVPVIILTGLNNEIIGNQAVKAGAQDFLVKGQFDAKQMGRSIRYALQRFKTQTKLEELARSLAISENRYLEAQEMAQFGNWEMDIVTNAMKWSAEMFRIFGFQPNSLSPSLSDYMSYVHYEDKKTVAAFFEAASKDGRLHRIEHRIIINVKEIKHLALQSRIFFDEYTEKVLLVGVVQDITERKMSEDLLLEKQLASQAYEMQEEQLSDLNFRIRTPLNSVMNLLYLFDKSEISTQQAEILKDLKYAVDDIHLVINNLLNYNILTSEKLQLQKKEVKAHEFIAGLEKMLKLKVENAGLKELKWSVKNELPEKLKTDPAKVTQMLYNIAGLITQNLSEKNTLKIQIEMKAGDGINRLLRFCFQDDGPDFEIPDSEKTEQNSPPHDESSEEEFSIAIIHRLLKNLGGQLVRHSVKGQGNGFAVEIPVSVPIRRKMFEGNKPDSPLRILLVEDHFLNQMSTRKVLTAWSDFVSIDIAENGEIGVEMFKKNSYDLILMDLQMPVMNGIEATEKILQIAQIPIIALTANASKSEADECFKAGMVDYISKPFKPEELYNSILNVMVVVEQE